MHLSGGHQEGWWEEIPAGDRLCAGEVYRTMRFPNVSNDTPFFDMNYLVVRPICELVMCSIAL